MIIALWQRRPLVAAALFVLIITGWRLAALATSDLNLFFDEAQYWFWSTEPALGYFSKPPMIAWLIAVGTAIAGDTEFGVRLMSPLCYVLVAAFGAGIAATIFDRKTAAWTAMTLATLPAVSLSAQLASTDMPLLLCWSAMLMCLLRYWKDGGWWWLGFGVAFGAGLMSKYAMAYILLCLPFAFVLVPDSRRLLQRPGLWGGLIIGFLLFLPNIWWNWTHELASFSHTAANANWNGPTLKPHKLAEFAGAQFGVMGPILLLAYGWAICRWRSLSPGERMLVALSAPVLGLMLVQSLISRAHANWAAVTYIAATVLVTGWLLRLGWEKWLRWSLAVHVLAMVMVQHMSGIAPLVGIDPWHRMRGWEQMAATVSARLAEQPDALLMARERHAMASLLFYVPPQPPDWIKLRRGEVAGDHYELVSNPAAIGTRPILYIVRTKRPDGVAESLRKRFDRVTVQEPIPREMPTRRPEVFSVFLLEGYRG